MKLALVVLVIATIAGYAVAGKLGRTAAREAAKVGHEAVEVADDVVFGGRHTKKNRGKGSSSAKNVADTAGAASYKFGVISDLDKKSKVEGGKQFVAYLKKGELNVNYDPENPENSKVSVTWSPDSETQTIKSGFAYEGRGLELSTLNKFNDKLYTCGDKTGIVFELQGVDTDKAEITEIPFAILNAGEKGFKCEWATVKNGNLWIGGHGAPSSPRLLKQMNKSGRVVSSDWSHVYKKIAKALSVKEPGYVTNEAAAWSDIKRKWVFAPRKINKEAFDDAEDEKKGSNKFLIANDSFDDIEVKTVGELIPTHGFASIKFIPNTGDNLILAIKSVEAEGVTETYIMAFDINGNVVMDETLFAEDKYEGLEFL